MFRALTGVIHWAQRAISRAEISTQSCRLHTRMRWPMRIGQENDYRPRRNGNSLRAEGWRESHLFGASNFGPMASGWPILTKGIFPTRTQEMTAMWELHQWLSSLPTTMASTTWRGTCGNG